MKGTGRLLGRSGRCKLACTSRRRSGRITIAKAERVDVARFRLELASIIDRLKDAEQELLGNVSEGTDDGQGDDSPRPKGSGSRGGGGRRDLDLEKLFERPQCVALDGFPPSGTTKRVTLHEATRAGGHDETGREALLK